MHRLGRPVMVTSAPSRREYTEDRSRKGCQSGPSLPSPYCGHRTRPPPVVAAQFAYEEWRNRSRHSVARSGKVERCASRHSGHVRMVRCRASCSSPGSTSPLARDTPVIVPISALARGHDHPQGVTTSPAVRSTMDTLSEVFTRRVCPGRHFRSVDGP